jgi:hypothetical protein
VYLLRDAVLRGGYTRAGVRAYLDGFVTKTATIQGVGGPFTLGRDHDARRPLYIAEVRDQGFHVLKAVSVR